MHHYVFVSYESFWCGFVWIILSCTQCKQGHNTGAYSRHIFPYTHFIRLVMCVVIYFVIIFIYCNGTNVSNTDRSFSRNSTYASVADRIKALKQGYTLVYNPHAYAILPHAVSKKSHFLSYCYNQLSYCHHRVLFSTWW